MNTWGFRLTILQNHFHRVAYYVASMYKQTIQGLITVLTEEKKMSGKMASSSLQNNKSWLHAK